MICKDLHLIICLAALACLGAAEETFKIRDFGNRYDGTLLSIPAEVENGVKYRPGQIAAQYDMALTITKVVAGYLKQMTSAAEHDDLKPSAILDKFQSVGERLCEKIKSSRMTGDEVRRFLSGLNFAKSIFANEAKSDNKDVKFSLDDFESMTTFVIASTIKGLEDREFPIIDKIWLNYQPLSKSANDFMNMLVKSSSKVVRDNVRDGLSKLAEELKSCMPN